MPVVRLFVVVAVAVVLGACGHDAAAARRAVVAYADGVATPTGVARRIVDEEVRPALDDLRGGHITPDQFRSEAGSWRAQLQAVRRDVAAVKAPKKLRDASHLYDRVLREYIGAIDAWAAASYSTTAQLPAALTRGDDLAEAALDRWRDADRLVADERRRATAAGS
jgi:hypothetical protein